MSSYCCFPGFLILPVRTWLSAFFTLKLIVKTIKRKLILHMNLPKAFIFQHGLKLKLIFLKSNAQVTKSICYRKYNHEVEEHLKVLSAIIDTIIRQGRLGLSFIVMVMTQSIIQMQERTQLAVLAKLQSLYTSG